MNRVTYVRLVAAMLVLTAISSVVLLQFDWFGPSASDQREPIDTLFDVMIVLSCFVFAIVTVMFTYAIWKFRVRPGDEGDGKPIHGNTKLEIAWTVIPTVIVLFGAAYSWVVLDDIEAKEANALPVTVIGQQFKWTFEYPDATVGEGEAARPVSSDVLHVPVDRQIEFTNVALDVLHSFWVPEWGIKRDAVPAADPSDQGVDDSYVVNPNEEGTFSVVCTELCGTGHATMRATVVVESQEEFDAWLADQTRAQQALAGGGTSGG